MFPTSDELGAIEEGISNSKWRNQYLVGLYCFSQCLCLFVASLIYTVIIKLVVCIDDYRSHVAEVHIGLHRLPVHERIHFKVAVLTHEARNTHQPSYLAELLEDRVASRALRSSSNTTQLVVPRTRNRRRTRSFSSAAPRIWNSLPRCARECLTQSTFKSQLKTFLLH